MPRFHWPGQLGIASGYSVTLVRTWLLIFAAVFSVACQIGVANATTGCAAVGGESRHSNDCPDHREMNPDAMPCAQFGLALAPTMMEELAAPEADMVAIAGKLISLVGSTDGPEPPPPRTR